VALAAADRQVDEINSSPSATCRCGAPAEIVRAIERFYAGENESFAEILKSWVMKSCAQRQGRATT